MCTVSFVPVKTGVLLGSNRDEKHLRSDAIPPVVYKTEQGQMLYPRDADAGGTWIAMHEAGHALIFLNGGFIKHTPAPPYRKSRGQVLLDIIQYPDPAKSLHSLNLAGIEPFTAVLWTNGRLIECRWDGQLAYITEKNAAVPHIWSSVTLYAPEVIQRREQWFEKWLTAHPAPTLTALLDFHQFTGDGDAHNDLLMNRNGHVYTVSITGVEMDETKGLMKYIDLKNHQQYNQELPLSTPQTIGQP